MLDDLYTPAEAAEFLRLRPETLRKYRQAGNGPKYIRLNSKVIRYRHEDLVEFLRNWERQ